MRQRLWRAKRWLKYRLASHALILMYHRVTLLENDPHLLAVKPDHFAAHLEVLRGRCSPIPLHQLTEALLTGSVPNRAVVITFDDGYTDNLYQARPLLERYEIPATVFVTAGQVGRQREFWWDELDQVLLQPGTLPARLQLNLAGNTLEWDLDQAAEYSVADYLRHRDWHIERQDAPTTRHRLFLALFDQLGRLPATERQKVLDDLCVWANAEPTARLSHQSLIAGEMIHLVEGGLVEIGAHTMTHPHLANLPVAAQQDEIRQSRKSLEAILDRPVTTFAFPHGSTTPEAVACLQESGFFCAVTSHYDAVWPGADRFLLPRIGVRDLDGDAFAHWLGWWLDG